MHAKLSRHFCKARTVLSIDIENDVLNCLGYHNMYSSNVRQRPYTCCNTRGYASLHMVKSMQIKILYFWGGSFQSAQTVRGLL
jgi:hypothetical protein